MQITIFGATGSLGGHLLTEALAQGYHVKAFTRNAEKLNEIKNSRLSIVQGDVQNYEEVLPAIKGADAVVCALGDGAKGKVRGSGTLNIIIAMQKSGVKRLICQTTLGLGESWHNLNFFWKRIMFGILLRKAFQDHKFQEEYIRRSHLDYTIIRPSAFTDGPPTRDFKVGFNGQARDLSLKISRTDVANFMLDQIRSDEFLRQTVSISA